MNRFNSLFTLIAVALMAIGCGRAQEPSFRSEQNAEVDTVSKPASTAASSAVSSATTAAASRPASTSTAGSPAVATDEEGLPKYTFASYITDRQEKALYIYSDDEALDNHYFPSGWMGDYPDLIFDTASTENPHSGTTTIKVEYKNKASLGARWVGVYWQNPANNWGGRPGGYNLTGATKLTFWARGAKGGERIEEFKVGGVTGEYSDTDMAGIGPVMLTPDWKQYVISLEGKDLSAIVGGFAWAANLEANPDGMIFFLDDIRFE